MSQFSILATKDNRGVMIVSVMGPGYAELLTTEADDLIKKLQAAVNTARAANRPKIKFGDH